MWKRVEYSYIHIWPVAFLLYSPYEWPTRWVGLFVIVDCGRFLITFTDEVLGSCDSHTVDRRPYYLVWCVRLSGFACVVSRGVLRWCWYDATKTITIPASPSYF